MMNILLVRLSSMGDVVMQTSLVKALKQNYPDINISFLTFDSFSTLIDDEKVVDEVIGIPRVRGLKGISYLYKLSKNLRRFGLIIDLHATTRSNTLRKMLFTTPHIVVDKRRIERTLLVKTGFNLLKKDNEPYPQVKRILDDFKFFFDLRNVQADTDTKYTYTTEELSGEFPLDKYIVFAPSASFVNKRWPVESFIDLAEMILDDERFNSYKIVILAGKEDSFCIAFNRVHSDRLVNLQGKTSLHDSSLLVKYAKGFVGNDSGLGHIANSCNVPLVTLFGPTSEYFGFVPYGKTSRAISVDMDCRPCSTTGKDQCKFATLKCMEAIKPDVVFNSLIGVMSNA